MYKLISSARNTDGLSIGFDRSRDRRQKELANNKNIKRKYHIRIYLKDIFGFAENDKTLLGLGYRLISTRNNDNAVLNKGNAINNAKIKINSFECYVPHYTPSLEQQTILSNQIVKKLPTEIRYIERPIFVKEVNTQKSWTFELGDQEGINVPIWIIGEFQRSDRQHDQNLNNDTFYRPPVTSGQCIIGTERYPHNSILSIYNDDDYSQGYGQRRQAFRALTKVDIPQPYISEHDFRTSNDGDKVGYKLYVFDIRFQKNFTAFQPIKIEFKCPENVPAGICGYALVLTNEKNSFGSDGQRHFVLI